MLTHFGTGAIRALYPVTGDVFLVGSVRAVGYPFAEQITFQRDGTGNVTGLIWQTRDPITGKPGEAEQATRLSLQSEIVHFTSEDGINLTGLLTLPANPGPYPAIIMLHGSEPGTKDNFGNQQMSAFWQARELQSSPTINAALASQKAIMLSPPQKEISA